ncbi:MAG: N-6 DNA methylase, partial [candidate division Zixibacteria bacterium]|nr:N-6 DNA methylase [candidate division Zixibacteria bacterium]
MNNEEIRAELKRLINKRKSIDEDTSEANICANFVDQLFLLLGWDIADVKQYDRNSYVRGAGFADIALKIDNDPVIFVEVKKIGKIRTDRIDPKAQMTLPIRELADLIDRTPEEKQAFKYARGKEIPWAILTNFDCLYVFNADQERIILSFKKPEEYLERLDDLLQLSREKVKAKSLKWVQEQLKKEEMDKSFLEKLKNWRVRLAQNICDKNKDNHILKDDKGKFDLDKLMEIVQRVLSRLMIIQIADDREVLKRHSLLENLTKTYENMGDYTTKDHLLKKFIDLSEMMDMHHNTSIFTPGHPCDKVFISNSVLDEVIKRLCNVSFRKMTADILGATYESYLGYKFNLKNGKIEAEVDPRVRKQAGIYYTPAYIVRYIVDNTLGVKLKELEDQYDLEAGEKAKDLKILDPACGSGSFLIYAFDVLAEFYERLNKKITDKQLELSKGRANPDMFQTLEEFKHLPPKVADYPKRILEEHLYGVDLDPAAAEIATINLVIKAFEKMRDKKLPLILNQNVKVGNTLVSGVQNKEDLEKFKQEITEHADLRKRLKQNEDEEEKRELMKQIDKLRRKVNSQFNESLKEYFSQPEEKRPFNWEFEFPEIFDSEKSEEQKGFDVVIGNPPYKDIKELDPRIVDYMFSSYATTSNRMNIYSSFVHRGHQLLRQNGSFGHIIPNSILTQSSYRSIRSFLLNHSQLLKIVRLPNKTFPEATVETIILVFRKKEQVKRIEKETDILIFDSNDVINSIEPSKCKQHYGISQKIWQKNVSNIVNIYTPQPEISFLEKIEKSTGQLNDLAEFSLGLTPYDKYKGHTKKQIREKIFHASHKKDKSYKKLLSGEDIRRYSLNWNGREWISYGEWLGAPRERRFFTEKRILVRQIISGDLPRIYATYT